MAVPDTLPKTYAVGRARVVDDAPALNALASGELTLRDEVVLAQASPAPLSTAGTAGTSRIMERSADRVRLEVELERPGYVVLLDAFDPGWRARVDGQDAEVLRANIAFRAVQVSGGRHLVEFRYRPPSVFWGLLLSGLTLVGAAFGAFRRAQ